MVLWLLVTVLGLVLLVVVALQFPQVQQFGARKGAAYLSEMLNTRVEIGGFTTDWRNTLVLKHVYVEDQQQDTLWYSERLGADLKLFSLLKGEVNVGKVHLQNATAKLHIRPDSTSNFDFLVDAFATDTTAAQPADTAAMKINLGLINLENVYVSLRDEAGGNHIRARVGQLLTTMEALDLEKEQYLVDEVELRNTWVDYVQTKLPPDEEPEPITFSFGLNRVQLEQVKLNFVNRVAEQRINLFVGESELVADKIDLPNARVDLRAFRLHDAALAYAQDKYKHEDSLAVKPVETVKKLDKAVEKTQGQAVEWVVNLGELDVSGLKAVFDNFNTPAQARGMDFNHLLFSDIELQAQNLLYSQDRMGLDLNQLKLREKSGFRIENFTAAVSVDSTRARLTDLDLKTGHSHILKELGMDYPSLAALSEQPERVALAVDVENSRIGMQDVLFFAPFLADNPSFRAIASSTVRIHGRANGELDDLRVQRFQLAGLQGTALNVSGRVQNATDPDRLFLDLDIHRLATTRTDVQALAPAGTLPPDIRLPGTLSMSGNFRGGLTAFDAEAAVRTSFGNLQVKVDMEPGLKGAEPFRASISSGGFDVGQLLVTNGGLGKVAIDANARGTGLTPETMRATLQATIREAVFNEYSYTNIAVNAAVNRNLYTVEATANDQNLAFTLNGDFNLRNTENPAYTFNLDLKGANLDALNFYPEPLGVQGQLKGSFTGADLGSLSGTLDARQLVVRHNQQTHPVDSLLLTLNQANGGTNVQVQSDVMALRLESGNNLEELPVALQKHFSNYFDLQPDPPYPAHTNLAGFTFELALRKTGLITSFVPGLEALNQGAPLTGSYNAETKELQVNGAFSRIVYTGYNLRDLNLQVRGDRNKLDYNISLKELSDSTLLVNNITFSGAARDNNLGVRLAVAEDNGNERFVLGGLLNSLGRGYRFAFEPGQVVLNGEAWSVPEDNYLQFGPDFLYAHNIRMERNGSFLLLNSQGPVTPGAPLQVQFGNFRISTIMETLQRTDSLVMGTINGHITLQNLLAGNLAFTSDLTVSDFMFTGVPVGDIAVHAENFGGNRYDLNAALTGNGNNLQVSGFYEAQPNASLLNLDANVGNINLASLQGFTQGMVKDMGGSTNGRLRITGTLADPDITGQLNFSAAQFNPTMLNTLYRLQNERLVFTTEGIQFPGLTLTDAQNNSMVINGMVFTQNYTDFRFDLQVNTNRFLAMNSTAKDNDLYYGKLLMAASATVTGNMNEPAVRAQVRVLDGSALTFVVPGEEAGAAERAGVVEFVNFSDTLNAMLARGLQQQGAQAGFTGIDLRANITVTDATNFNIVIDPVTGDNLNVRGNGTLEAGISPGGQIDLAGRYEITEGKYEMEFYELVSRELFIERGSYIVWNGDPMTADIRVAAIYRTKTAPAELVSSEIASLDPAERNRFKTQLPFEVYVNLTGEMLKPEIDFDIQLPESDRAAFDGQIEAKLMRLRQDEAELNKQVFALLVLNRFLAPDPLESSGGGLGATARNSVSQVMSDQLNNLTNQFAPGLGLELGVNSYEDYSTGSAQGRTDLNVGLRQQFFNDRLTVRVGSDIGLEGQRREQNSMSNFGGDISVEYSLTADGRLRVRGFQRNEYEGFLEGDVQETGLGLIFVRDYNNFSDLFRKLEKRQEKARARRQKELAGTPE